MLNYSILLAAWVFMVWLETASTLRAASLREKGLARRKPRTAGVVATIGAVGMLSFGVAWPIVAWCFGLYPVLGVIAAGGACIGIVGIVVLVRRGLPATDGIPVAASWLGKRPWVYHLTAWIGLVLLTVALDSLTKSRLTHMQSDIVAEQRAMRPTVIPENNARDDYLAAFPLLRNLDRQVIDWLMADEVTSAPPALSEPMRRAVVLLRNAASKPQVEWDDAMAQKIADPDGDLKLFRQGTNLLRIDALNAAAAGQMHDAIADVRAIEQIARHVGQGQSLMEGLVAIGIDAQADSTVSELLPFVERAEDLQSLTPPDGQWHREVRRRMLESEKLSVMRQYIDMCFGRLQAPDGSSMLSAPMSVPFRLLVVDAELREWQRIMSRYLDAAALDSRQAVVRVRQLDREQDQRGFKGTLFASMSAAGVGKTVLGSFEVEMLSRLRDVGIAVKKYSLENKAWPASLEELAKRGYLQKVPPDMFSDSPILMVTKPDGVVVYSVGVNGKDDGGTAGRQADIVFLVPNRPLWEKQAQQPNRAAE